MCLSRAATQLCHRWRNPPWEKGNIMGKSWEDHLSMEVSSWENHYVVDFPLPHFPEGSFNIPNMWKRLISCCDIATKTQLVDGLEFPLSSKISGQSPEKGNDFVSQNAYKQHRLLEMTKVGIWQHISCKRIPALTSGKWLLKVTCYDHAGRILILPCRFGHSKLANRK